jgi:hypothetical protein
MSVTFPTAYPAALTNAAWQKKKTFKEKLKSKTKTGLGETLIAAEKAWKLVPFTTLAANKQAQTRGVRSYLTVQHNRAAAQEAINGSVNTAHLALMAASRKANATSQNAALSPASKTAATTLSSALMKQAVLLKGIKLDDFDEEINEGLATQQRGEQEYRQRIGQIQQILTQLRTQPTQEAWERAQDALDKAIFLSYHFVITSVDTLKLDNYKPVRPVWARIDELNGRAKPAIKAAAQQVDKAIAVRDALRDFNRDVTAELKKAG